MSHKPLNERKRKKVTSAATSIASHSVLLTNSEAGYCQFCDGPLPPHLGVRLQECHHLFCRGCLQFAIVKQSESMEIPCLVWYFADCGGFLKDCEVKQLVSPEMYQEYIDRSLIVAKKTMKNVFSCKTEGCRGWCEFEKGRKTFVCPVCNQINCMECVTIHTYGENCDKFRKRLSAQGKVTKVQRERENGWAQLVHLVKLYGSSFEIAKIDLLPNSQVFECPICFCDISPGKGVILHECLHMFCKSCLIHLVDHNEEASVKCPNVDDNQSCCQFLQPREIKALVPNNIHEKHLQRSVKLGESSSSNSFHCKTPNCSGWCVHDAGVTRFQCPVCQKQNCITCKAVHENMSCADYRNSMTQNQNERLSEATLELLVQRGEYMRCPTCRILVQKISGCDWLSCIVCKTQLCWATKQARCCSLMHLKKMKTARVLCLTYSFKTFTIKTNFVAKVKRL